MADPLPLFQFPSLRNPLLLPLPPTTSLFLPLSTRKKIKPFSHPMAASSRSSNNLHHCHYSSPTAAATQPSLLVFSGLTRSPSVSIFWILIQKCSHWFPFSHFFWNYCSGGTAFNGVVEELKNLTTRVAHVLPVSDDGGSTAEIVRVLGKVFDGFSFSWFWSPLFRLEDCFMLIRIANFLSKLVLFRWSCSWRHKVQVFEIIWSKHCWSSSCS